MRRQSTTSTACARGCSVNNTVLITGATGFIGRPLAARLRGEGREVVAIGSAQGDIADPATLRPMADRGIGHVVHLAGRTYVPESWAAPRAFFDTNAGGTLNVLEFCRAAGASLTFLSAYLYGIPERLPIAEDAPVRPNNPYALSKHLAEEACRFYSAQHGVAVGIARVFNVFGPGQDARFLIPTILSQLQRDPAVEVRDLAPRRDYVYLDDAVDALAKLAAARPKMATYNVASGTSRSVGDIIAAFQAALGTRKPVIGKSDLRHNEIPEVIGDASRAAADLGWRPKVSFEQGAARLVQESVAANTRLRA